MEFVGFVLHLNQRVIIIMFWLQQRAISHDSGKASQDAVKDGLGLLLVTAEPLTIMLVSFVPCFRIKDSAGASERKDISNAAGERLLHETIGKWDKLFLKV